MGQPITRIEIENFQCHAAGAIDFAPTSTTIIGPSDVGKSAWLRALRWVALNVPQGDAFIRHGSSAVRVRVFVGGRAVERWRKRTGENGYSLDGQEFRAFGNGVPDAISQLLAVSPLNFVGQHTPPYWFSETAGEVSRQLNAVVDLGVIDAVLDAAGSDVRALAAEVRASETRLVDLTAAADALAWVPTADAVLAELEAVERDRARKTTDASRLGGLLKSTRFLRQAETAAEKRATDAGCLGRAVLAWRKVSARRASLVALVGRAADLRAVRLDLPAIDPLADGVRRYTLVRGRASELGRRVQAVREKKKEAGRPVPDMGGLSVAVDKLAVARRTVSRLRQAVRSATSAAQVAELADSSASVCLEEIRDLSAGRCPVCGGPFDGRI